MNVGNYHYYFIVAQGAATSKINDFTGLKEMTSKVVDTLEVTAKDVSEIAAEGAIDEAARDTMEIAAKNTLDLAAKDTLKKAGMGF